MRSQLMFTAVESHTEGMPTSVTTGSVGLIPGATNEDRAYFIEQLHDICCLLMNESPGRRLWAAPSSSHPPERTPTGGCLHRGVRMPALLDPKNPSPI